MGPDAMILVFWMLGFKPTFSLSSLTFIKRLFSSSSLSAIRVVSSAYLRLLLFLPAILIHFSLTSFLAHVAIRWLTSKQWLGGAGFDQHPAPIQKRKDCLPLCPLGVVSIQMGMGRQTKGQTPLALCRGGLEVTHQFPSCSMMTARSWPQLLQEVSMQFFRGSCFPVRGLYWASLHSYLWGPLLQLQGDAGRGLLPEQLWPLTPFSISLLGHVTQQKCP